ncbi:MAG: hypothetical protein QCH99_01680 [Candidatus Bathyarchaeota archaeon]|nr:hypothetical protein [Candidatus Bathyarchaeum tardum]
MMETQLSSKMAEFMVSLDQVKKYRTLVVSMTDFILIVLGTVIACLFIHSITQCFTVFVGRNNLLSLVSSLLIIVIFPSGIVLATLWVNRKLKSVKTGRWKNTLKEGVSGSIELLQNIDWAKTYNDIRYAKLGFFLYGFAKVTVFWGLAIVSLSLVNSVVETLIHLSIDSNLVMIFSLVIVLILSKKDLVNRYEEIGRLDWLLWELRWFESEFRGADFEA